MLDEDNAASISQGSAASIKAKEVLSNRCLQEELILIEAHFGFLLYLIKKIDSSRETLVDVLAIIQEARDKLVSTPGAVGQVIRKKTNEDFGKNLGLKLYRQWVNSWKEIVFFFLIMY